MGPDGAVGYLEVGYDPPEGIENRVEYESLEWCIRVTLGSRYLRDDL